jgi:hypothetical protein
MESKDWNCALLHGDIHYGRAGLLFEYRQTGAGIVRVQRLRIFVKLEQKNSVGATDGIEYFKLQRARLSCETALLVFGQGFQE